MLTPLEQATSNALLHKISELIPTSNAGDVQTLSVTFNHIVSARLASENNLRDEFAKCYSNGEFCGENAQGTSSEAPAETAATPTPAAEPVSRTRRKKGEAAPAETPAVETPAVGNAATTVTEEEALATTPVSAPAAAPVEAPAAPEVDPALAEDEPAQTPAELRALSKQRYLKLCADYQNDDAKLRSFKDNVTSLFKAAGGDRIATVPDDKIAKFYEDLLTA